MRLLPAGMSARMGEPGSYLTHEGQQYPKEGCMVLSAHQLMHREPAWWPHPDVFIPERWLVLDTDPNHPTKGAWRGFEWGPRNCIGQEFSLLELKLVMVMTVRRFRIEARYDEGSSGQEGRDESMTVQGERAYQVIRGTARPAEGLPCKVTLL